MYMFAGSLGKVPYQLGFEGSCSVGVGDFIERDGFSLHEWNLRYFLAPRATFKLFVPTFRPFVPPIECLGGHRRELHAMAIEDHELIS